ncbi:MAG: DUF2927 domain-containing protein, partial [Bacteroidota bacterium]
MRIWLKIILWFGWVGCLPWACSTDLMEEEATFPERYELYFSYSPNADYYMRRHLIDYFASIALGAEYGVNLPLLKKWVKPMQIYVSGRKVPALMEELDEIVAELNALFTDGFYMELVEDSLAANFHIYLGDRLTYSKLYPNSAPLLKNSTGLFTYYLNPDFSIESGHMFVLTDNSPLRYQKHVLREELTQSLGLSNDIETYGNSIFYQQRSDVQQYSNLDIEVIRLLYHPRLIPKLGPTAVTSILEN